MSLWARLLGYIAAGRALDVDLASPLVAHCEDLAGVTVLLAEGADDEDARKDNGERLDDADHPAASGNMRCFYTPAQWVWGGVGHISACRRRDMR